MSLGPGKIERAIEAAFRGSPRATFSVAELLPHAYPGVNRIEKKHRVAILRAADKVAARLGWQGWKREARGGETIYLNRCDIRSYAIGRMRTGYPAYTAEAAAHVLEDPSHYRHAYYRGLTRPGGSWWRHAVYAQAVRDGDDIIAAGLLEAIQEHDGKILPMLETLRDSIAATAGR